MIKNYEKQVYAGVLGKVIGVYVGRPIEGWNKARIETRWGRIERYVHEDRGVPLVMANVAGHSRRRHEKGGDDNG